MTTIHVVEVFSQQLNFLAIRILMSSVIQPIQSILQCFRKFVGFGYSNLYVQSFQTNEMVSTFLLNNSNILVRDKDVYSVLDNIIGPFDL